MSLNKGKKIEVDNTSNVGVCVIHITEDKLINILNKHITRIRKSNDWLSSFGMTATLWMSLFTSDFKSTFGLSGETMQGVVITSAIASTFYFVYVVYNIIVNRDGVDSIMKDIKNEKK